VSTGVMTRERPGEQAGQPGPARFADVLRAEWTKFRTVRGWVIGMIVAAVLIDVVGLLGVQSSIGCGGGRTGAACIQPVPTGPGGEAVTDSFYFVHQPLASHGSITTRISSLTGQYAGGAGPAGPAGQGARPSLSPGVQPWSKAGILIKASTRPGSPYAAMLVTGGHGARFQDNYTQDVPGLPGKVTAAAPRWLRLTRSDDTVTGYDSVDGSHWTEVGAAHLAGLPATAVAGLFAASPPYQKLTSVFGGTEGQIGPSLATGVFDEVSLSGGQPGGRWAGSDIGASGPAYSGPQIGFRRAGGRFTVTGSGDIAPDVPGLGMGATIEEHLAGTFAGLIAIVVIAALFMTTEYRRGLIRTTLAATPRRGRVLAAKAVVIGLVAFVAGLPAAALAVVAGERMSHGQGQYVLPVTWLTEARVIVGAAALLAVAAVLAVAIGALVRRSAAAVAAVIVAIVLPYILGVAQVLPLGAAEWLLRVTPAAAFAIQQSIPQYAQVTAPYTPPVFFPLSPWAGFAVLCGYAAAALALAMYLLRRRDA
jgi:ABC-type transport system involved in multi-copper enzyme maturation permease subunit